MTVSSTTTGEVTIWLAWSMRPRKCASSGSLRKIAMMADVSINIGLVAPHGVDFVLGHVAPLHDALETGLAQGFDAFSEGNFLTFALKLV